MGWARRGSVAVVLAGLFAVTSFGLPDSVTFAESPVTIPLKPGWNLVSLPGEPTDSAIDMVLSGTDVLQVVTLANGEIAGVGPVMTNCLPIPPEVLGPECLTAERSTSGEPFSGDLTTIEDGRGYWMKSTTFAPMSVGIPPPTGSPISYPVYAGWNMVGVTTEGDVVPGDVGSADTYFGSTNWTTAYTFDPSPNIWIKLLPISSSNVEVGLGYFLYVVEDGILVPGFATAPSPTPEATPTITPTPIPGVKWWGLLLLAGVLGALLLWHSRYASALR